MKRFILIISVLLFAATSIFAQEAKTPKLDRKQKKQIHKIEKGIKSGDLTRFEAKKLKKQKHKLAKMEKRAKADGKVTKRERIRLNKEAKKLDRKIYKEKHDMQKRK